MDDLKGGATPAVAKKFLEYLESNFGKYKAEYTKFIHTGIEHERKPGGILCRKWNDDSLKPLDLSLYKGKTEDETLVDEALKESFSSLLGGVAWTALSGAESAVYIQALQRRGSKPRYVDCM